MEGSCPERHSRFGNKWFNTISKPVLITVAWILLWRAAALMEYAPHASIWFPPSGVTYAVFLIFGWRAIPIVLFASITTTFWEDSIYQGHQSSSTLLLTGLLLLLHIVFLIGLVPPFYESLAAQENNSESPT